MRAFKIILAAALIASVGFAFAQVFESRSFDDPENARRYQELISELRCLVCQNQNLADSNADLASDLRDITYDMVRDGKSDAEILDFMTARYGDFVLYRPPFRAATALLWAGPFLLLGAGMVLLLVQIRRRQRAAPGSRPVSGEERSRLEHLLKTGGDRERPRGD